MGECLIIKSGGGTDTSNATATNDTVLQGYSCYAKDVLVNGSVLDMTLMENADTSPGNYPMIPVIDVGPEALNNVWITNNADGVKRFCIRIPKNGYYPTNCFVGIDISLIKNELLEHASQITSGKPATGDKILTGYSGYANGVKIDGTMPDRGAVMYSLPINGSYTIPAGYHNGNGKITQNVATQGGWTVTPGTGNILACAAGRYVTGTIYCAGSGNLVAGNIRNGVNIFGVVGNFVGWVDATMPIEAVIQVGAFTNVGTGGESGDIFRAILTPSVLDKVKTRFTKLSFNCTLTTRAGNGTLSTYFTISPYYTRPRLIMKVVPRDGYVDASWYDSVLLSNLTNNTNYTVHVTWSGSGLAPYGSVRLDSWSCWFE